MFFEFSPYTASFTAKELSHFLKLTLDKTDISYANDRPEQGFFIELAITHPASLNCSFTIEPVNNGIVITEEGRTGLLYGAYEFLRMQGWHWYAPGDNGQVAPDRLRYLILPKQKKMYGLDMDLGRGFHLEEVLQESYDLWVWMARNRLNMSGYRPVTGPLANKLGMIFSNGGHIFEKVLDPDRQMPSGKILWDEHPDWFGMPENGIRKKESAFHIQFCVSQPELIKFLGKELLQRLMGDWKQANLINIWGFDTWGSTCKCEKCTQLGNSTEQMLYLLSEIRAYLNNAIKEGLLDHEVRLAGCAYEGTSSLTGPEKPFPENLIDAGDVVIFYPINRCYVHNFFDKTCKKNANYLKDLASWAITHRL